MTTDREIDEAMADFEATHGEDVWTYMEHADEMAGEQFAEHGMGCVSMGWDGGFATESANMAVAEGTIYSTRNDPVYAEAKALADRKIKADTPALDPSTPVTTADFTSGLRPAPADDDIPF